VAGGSTRAGKVTPSYTFVFDLEGPKGKGRAYMKSKTNDSGNEVFVGVLFALPDGEEILVEGERPPLK
jgi:hypothetical protein